MGEIFNSKFVKINGINDLTEFVRQASKVDGDVLVRRGSYCVAGSSLMGMMSINISEGAMVEYPIDATEFGAFLDTLKA